MKILSPGARGVNQGEKIHFEPKKTKNKKGS
jgi:hypothetical protein